MERVYTSDRNRLVGRAIFRQSRSDCEVVIRNRPALDLLLQADIQPQQAHETPRKLLDTSKLTVLGRFPQIDLRKGMQLAYAWFVANQHQFRG